MQAPKPPSTKPKKKLRSDSQGLRKAKGFIDRALWELRAGPVLSIPVRKWLADSLDEKVDSRFRLVIKQKAGQPQGNFGMTFDGVRMEAAEYVAALMRYRGRNSDVEPPYGFESAISEGITWASKAPRDRRVKRSTLAEEYKRWKNSVIPPRTCEFFEGTETEAQVAERQTIEEKLSEDLNNSRDPVEMEEESRWQAQCGAEDVARRMSARFARSLSEDVISEFSTRMADWFRKHSPGPLTTNIATILSEQLAQGFLEEMGKCLAEEMPKRLREATSDSTTPK